jgi:signal transduction histidine kinase
MLPIRVLVIDDDEDDYILTADLLSDISRDRYLVTWVSSYDAALNAVRDAKFDVCLVDYRLGAHSGLDLMQQLYAMGCRSPMILLTGQGDLAVDLHAMEMGAADYLVKHSVTAELLERTIRYALERERTMAELRRLTAAAEQANQAKSRFVANMSHEIRTPLHAVVGAAALLNTTSPTEEQADYIATISASSHLLLDLINGILDFSKIESDRLQLESIPVDIGALLAELRQLFQPLAEGKQLRFEITAPPTIPAVVMSDPVRLRQVLVNLINNALKFTERGGVTLIVDAETEITSGAPCVLRFAVRDTGIGIAPEKMDRLFQSFSQVDSSTTRRFGGAGLGLAISKKLVELFGGQIEVHSIPGAGSTFRFTLPCTVVSTPKQTMSLSAATGGGVNEGATGQPIFDETVAQRAPLTILLAEDNLVGQKITLRILAKFGYTAEAVGSGTQAIEQMMHHPYDLILMDIRMPGMDGIEATRRIRAMQFSQPAPTIIAMTAAATVEDRQRCLEAGMDDYISKPLAVTELRRLLEETYRRRNQN